MGYGGNWGQSCLSYSPPGPAECPGQLRDSPCPAFPLADPPRLLTSSVPALNKQLTTIHQLTLTPSHPAAPLHSAASTEHIPASAPTETLSRTTHDSNKPTPPSCPPTAQGGPGSGLNAEAGRKFACLRLSPGSWPAVPAAGMERLGVQLPAMGFSRAPQLSHGYKSINKRSVCRCSLL